MSRVVLFFRSLFWHVSRGCPKSSRELINQRYAICLACNMHDSINQQCKECGCNINNKKVFLNKLAWRDQQCPLNKW